MKWQEASVFYRMVTVVGFLCAFASLILSFFDLMEILTDTEMIARLLWCVFGLSHGILYWKTRRKLAILWFVVSGLSFLIGISYLFI